MGLNMDSIQAKILEYTRQLGGDVSLDTLFSKEFVTAHSQKDSAEALFTAAGIVSQETFDNWCGTDSADAYIRTETDFNSWNDMLSVAAKIFAKKKQLALRDGSWENETFNTGVLFKDIHILLNFSAG